MLLNFFLQKIFPGLNPSNKRSQKSYKISEIFNRFQILFLLKYYYICPASCTKKMCDNVSDFLNKVGGFQNFFSEFGFFLIGLRPDSVFENKFEHEII